MEEPTQEVKGPGCHPNAMSCPCPSWNPWNITPGLPSLAPSSVLAGAAWSRMVHPSSSVHRCSLPALLWSLLPHHKRTNISLCKPNYPLLFIASGSHSGRGSVTQPSYSSLARPAQLRETPSSHPHPHPHPHPPTDSQAAASNGFSCWNMKDGNMRNGNRQDALALTPGLVGRCCGVLVPYKQGLQGCSIPISFATSPAHQG